MSESIAVARLDRQPRASDLRALAALVVDAVESGAGVSFMAGVTIDEAEQWWASTVAALPERGAIIVARDRDGLAGCVMLHPAWAPNQPHRADVAKLIVHQRARRRGLSRALMAALEREARAAGFTLLVLDTCKGDDAERLYGSTGWVRVGEVPGFALNPDGSRCDTVFFYKQL